MTKSSRRAAVWHCALIAAVSATLTGLISYAQPRAATPYTPNSSSGIAKRSPTSATQHDATLAPGPAGSRRAVYNLSGLPLLFEANIGQAPAPIKYLARSQGSTLALLGSGLIFELNNAMPARLSPSAPQQSTASKSNAPPQLRLNLIHARAEPALRAEQQQASVSNYFIGKNRSKWYTNVANYRAVRYQQVYPGIDWLVHGNPQQLEYDFVVAPYANPRQIRLGVEGADELSIADDGDLIIKFGGQTVRELRPRIYQSDAAGIKHDLEGGYILDHKVVAFKVGSYDPARPLVIDPVVVYSTYLGGSGSNGDGAYAVTADSAGNVYLAGATSSTNFPVVGPFQRAERASTGFNAFVTKLNAAGTALIFSTYLGGSGDISSSGDSAYAIAIDVNSNVYVTGSTGSSDFPTTNAFQSANEASRQQFNAFVTKLDATGSALVYSTFLGGSGPDFASAIAVDGSGGAYVAGFTSSPNFPTANPFQATRGSASTAFVTKFVPNGSALAYSTYLGGSQLVQGCTTLAGDAAHAIAVDTAGNAYVAGVTAAANFPMINPFQSTNTACLSAFVTKFNASGSGLVYSTYLGGSSNGKCSPNCVSEAAAIAIDSAGDAYVAGTTNTSDFPTANAPPAPAPLQTTNNAADGGNNAFVSKLNSTGNALVYSTYLGGSGSDSASAIAVDTAGRAYVVGTTSSTDFPIQNALQSTNKGAAHSATNAFFSLVDQYAGGLELSTYLGGSGTLAPVQPNCVPCAPVYNGDAANTIALDGTGNIYIAGRAFSTDFPTENAFQGSNGATQFGSNAFVTKITMEVATGVPTAKSGGGGLIGWRFITGLALALAMRFSAPWVARTRWRGKSAG